MSNFGRVCWRCQLRASNLRIVKVNFSGNRASYIALAKAKHDGAGKAADRAPSDNSATNAAAPQPVLERHRSEAPESHGRVSARHDAGRYSGSSIRLPFIEKRNMRYTNLVEIEEKATAAKIEEKAIRQKTPLVVGVATQLDQLLQKPECLGEAWEWFCEHYQSSSSPHIVRPAYQDLRHIQNGRIFKRMLRALSEQWVARADVALPRPTEVIQKFREVRVLRLDMWDAASWPVAHQLLAGDAQGTLMSSDRMAMLATELIDWWTLYIKYHHPYAEKVRNLNARAASVWDSQRTMHLEIRMGRFLGSDAAAANSSAAALALLTCELFSKNTVYSSLSEPKRIECNDLIKLMLHLIHRRRIDRALETLRNKLGNLDEALHPAARNDLMRSIRQLPDRPYQTIISQRRSSRDKELNEGQMEEMDEAFLASDAKLASMSPAEQMERTFSSRIQRAVAQENALKLKDIWRQLRASYSDGQEKDGLNVPAILYDQLIAAYFELRRGAAALDVWNFMTEHGTQPTVKTWTAMLDACKKAKDFQAAEGIWERMNQSGVALDETAWIVRISCLAHAGRHKDALAALEDMGNRWIRAATAHASAARSGVTETKDNVKIGKRTAVTKPNGSVPAPLDISSIGSLPTAAKPNIDAVNAILAASVRRKGNNKNYNAGPVLRWASTFGLKPDVYTYNALISRALQQQDPSDAQRLLQQMSAQDVEPDVATYAIMFDYTFANASPNQDGPPEDIRNRTTAALDAVEAGGLRPNAHIYSQLVDRLLKIHKSEAACRVVLEHMHGRGLEPSEHVYTILVDHYASRDRPDVDGITSLMDRVESHFPRVNSIFYNRVALGYARADAVDRLMEIHARMRGQRREPSWEVFKETALALERAQAWQTLGELVWKLEHKKDFAPIPDGRVSRTQESVFWGIVWKLREEGKLPLSKSTETRGDPAAASAPNAADQAITPDAAQQPSLASAL